MGEEPIVKPQEPATVSLEAYLARRAPTEADKWEQYNREQRLEEKRIQKEKEKEMEVMKARLVAAEKERQARLASEHARREAELRAGGLSDFDDIPENLGGPTAAREEILK